MRSRAKETQRLDAVALSIAGIVLAQVQQILDSRTDLGLVELHHLSAAAERAHRVASRVLPRRARPR